jgi:hypothetical protein
MEGIPKRKEGSIKSRAVICPWPSPALLLLVSGPFGTQEFFSFYEHLRVLIYGVLFNVWRCLITLTVILSITEENIERS